MKGIFALSVLEMAGAPIVLKHDYLDENEPTKGLAPGVSVSLGEVFSTIQESLEVDVGGFIPSSVFYRTSRSMAWVVKSHERELFFSDSSNQFSVKVKLPNLVFHVVDKSKIRVCAVLGSAPKPNSRTFHAPLMNFYSYGSMCQGSVKYPDDLSYDNLEHWQSVVFDSFCSHVNHEKTLKVDGLESVNSVEYIKFMRKHGLELSKANLVPTGVTLADWLQV